MGLIEYSKLDVSTRIYIADLELECQEQREEIQNLQLRLRGYQAHLREEPEHDR